MQNYVEGAEPGMFLNTVTKNCMMVMKELPLYLVTIKWNTKSGLILVLVQGRPESNFPAVLIFYLKLLKIKW
jgi:hypothetical protein